jgi:hypothetical protein
METSTITLKNIYTGKLRLLSLVLMTLCLWGSDSLALDPMGPPTAGLKGGQFKFAIEYSDGEAELELNKGEWEEYFDGLLWDWGEAESLNIKKLETNKAYANFGYGFTDRIEGFLRIGGADAEFGDSIWEDDERFDRQGEFAFGAGIKATLYENHNLKVGALFQVSRADFDGKLMADHWALPDRVEMDLTEVQIAVGPTIKLADGLSIYGGPFFHIVDGDLDLDVDDGGATTYRYSWNIDEGSVAGGYIGAQLDFSENCSFNIEYQHTSSAEAACASLIWKF